MVKLYLRYTHERTVGVVASPGANCHYSHDARQCVVPALHAVHVWDTRTGEHTNSWTEDSVRGEVTAIARSPLSLAPEVAYFAVGYSDGSIRLWDPLSGECIVTLQGHKSAVTCLDFDASAQRLASGSKDTNVILWDLVEQCGLYRLQGHKDQITSVKFAEFDGLDHLVSSSKDTLIKMWDLKIQHCVETVMPHRGEVWTLSVLPESKQLLSGAADGEVMIWSIDVDFFRNNIETTAKNTEDVSDLGSRRGIVQAGVIDRLGKERIITIAVSKTGEYIGVQGADRSIELFKILNGQEIKQRIARKRRRQREKARKNNNTTQMSGDNEDEMEVDQHQNSNNNADEEGEGEGEEVSDIILTSAEKIPRVAIVRCSARVRSFDFSPAKSNAKNGAIGLLCTLTNNSAEIYLVEPTNQEEPTRLVSTLDSEGHRSDVRAVALSSTDEFIMSGSNESVKIWNATSGKCIKTFDSGAVLTAEFLPGNNYCVVGTRTGELQLFDLARSVMIESIQAHSGPIWSMQMRPDRKGFVTGSRDKEVRFWDLTLVEDEETGQSVPSLVHTRTLKMSDDVLCVRFSPDGKYLAVALLDSTVKILFADTLKFFLSLYGHKLPVVSIDISSDNLLIATASSDKTIKLWGLDFGDCHKSIIAHQEGVTNCRFVWGTHYLFSTGKDRLVKYWDMDRHEMIMKLDGHSGEVWALAVGKYGNFVVSGSHDRSIRIWKKTEDQFMLEEEREREMEEEFDEAAVQDADGDARYEGQGIGAQAEGADPNGQNEPEVGTAGRRTVETLKAGERLLEALEVYEEEQQQLSIYRALLKQQPDAVPPARNPLIIAQATVSNADVNMPSEEYVLRIIEGIRSSELEQALLILPFSKVHILIKVLGAWAKGGYKSSLAARILVFVAQIFQHELVASRSVRFQLEQTLRHLGTRIGTERSTAGFNLAALKHTQRITNLQ